MSTDPFGVPGNAFIRLVPLERGEKRRVEEEKEPTTDVFRAPTAEGGSKRARSAVITLEPVNRAKYASDTRELIVRYSREGMCLDFNPLNVNKEQPHGMMVTRQIGRPSKYGMVFEVKIKIDGESFLVATKVAPITLNESRRENENEAMISKMASILVEEGVTKAFPIFYGSIFCHDASFDENSALYRRAFAYATFSSMTMAMTDIAEINDFSTKVYSEALEAPDSIFLNPFKLARLHKEYFSKSSTPPPRYDYAPPIRAHLLVYELANMDIHTFFERGFSRLGWYVFYDMVIQVLQGISVLHSTLGVVHRDLHVGNVLVKKTGYKGSQTDYLITDFGISIAKTPDTVTTEEARTDVKAFIKTLILVCHKYLSNTSYLYIEPLLNVILNNVSVFDGQGKALAGMAVIAASSFVERNKRTTQFHMMTLNTKTIQLAERRTSAPSHAVGVGDEMSGTSLMDTSSSDITKGMRRMML